jgi:hypothetical protein
MANGFILAMRMMIDIVGNGIFFINCHHNLNMEEL